MNKSFTFLFQSIYAAPAYGQPALEQNNVEMYAELGPGGGRLGGPESLTESHYREAFISDIYDDVVEVKYKTYQQMDQRK